jgi:cell wall-associated NlpC family hydrolase
MRVSNATRQIVMVTLLASAAALACSARSVARPTTPSGPTASRSVRIYEMHRLAMRDSVVRLALAQVGTRYEFGGETPKGGFDCSGLVSYVFSQIYRAPPRLAAEQALIGAPIRRDDLRPGDLLTFGAGDSVTHVGIYVGDRKFVHASSVAGRVIVSPMDRPPSDLIRPLKGARRLLTVTDPLWERISG